MRSVFCCPGLKQFKYALVWIYLLKSKNQVFEKFKEFKLLVEKQFDLKIKCIRSDNGGEYISNECLNYLKSEGIVHERTVPKSPEQNGVAERMNRSLVEAVRTMLEDAHLSREFWAEALSTAVYLRNRCPTSALTGKTPLEALTSVKPNVSNLRTFGCICYSHISKDERQKLDAKSVKCILLGYGIHVKGYRLFDLEKRKVFYSRDVIFNESEKIDTQSQKESVVDNVHNYEFQVPLQDEILTEPAEEPVRPQRVNCSEYAQRT